MVVLVISLEQYASRIWHLIFVLLNKERSNVVSGINIVLVVRAITIWELEGKKILYSYNTFLYYAENLCSP